MQYLFRVKVKGGRTDVLFSSSYFCFRSLSPLSPALDIIIIISNMFCVLYIHRISTSSRSRHIVHTYIYIYI